MFEMGFGWTQIWPNMCILLDLIDFCYCSADISQDYLELATGTLTKFALCCTVYLCAVILCVYLIRSPQSTITCLNYVGKTHSLCFTFHSVTSSTRSHLHMDLQLEVRMYYYEVAGSPTSIRSTQERRLVSRAQPCKFLMVLAAAFGSLVMITQPSFSKDFE